jgi:hypothetical protein
MGIIVSGTSLGQSPETNTTLVERRLPNLFYSLTRKSLASSLFRPRRNILAVFDGVFYFSLTIVSRVDFAFQ